MIDIEKVEIEWSIGDINCDECGSGVIPRTRNAKASIECYCETCYAAAIKRAKDTEEIMEKLEKENSDLREKLDAYDQATMFLGEMILRKDEL